jgi:transcriptional regulator with XRE-family HTH domain
MIVRKLRLKKGWSQDHLSQLSGLSIRTIQRIERGQSPSLETLQALAAVFEIDISELQQENPMKTNTLDQQHEEDAINYVRDLKGFYSHAIKYAVVIVMLFVINLTTNPDYIWAIWPMLGWGIGVLFHGLNVFEVFNFLGPNWERKRIEKRLGKKL